VFGNLPVFDDKFPWETAQQYLEEQLLGDGLPLVIPTRSRLERMVSKVDNPCVSRGVMPPLLGELTGSVIAYNCVLAGCKVEEYPLVEAAAMACLDPEFNLLGVETTTGTAAVSIAIHGPVAQALGLNSRINCFGPGNRANACIGRALRLILLNVGGARPGVGDMATMGQPGKYTFCFAENDEDIFEPFHVRRGFRTSDSAVSVFAVSGTSEILPEGNGDTPKAILRPVAMAMVADMVQCRGAHQSIRKQQLFCLPPELAHLIKDCGWLISDISDFLFSCSHEIAGSIACTETSDLAVVFAPTDIHTIVVGGAGIKMSYLPIWAGGSKPKTIKTNNEGRASSAHHN
jgi:hypothetical protein